MNRIDRSEAFTRSGRSLVTDRPVAAPPAPPLDVDLSDDDFVPKGLRAWAGRIANGLYVQGLVDADGQTYISVGIRDQHQTFEVPRESAAAAFAHPFVYGCTIRL